MNYYQFLRENARWLFGGMMLTIFSAFGQSFFIGLYSAELIRTFDISQGTWGSIYMGSTLASAITLVLIGRIVDHRTVAVVAGVVICGLAVFCVAMAAVPSVWLLPLVIYGLRLFGQGMMTHVAFTAMGRWYVASRGRAVSVVTIGHQVGEAAFPPLFAALVLAVGWRQSWVIAAVSLVLVALPIIVLLMKTERVPLGTASAELEVGRQWERHEVVRDPLFWATCVGIFAPAYIGTSFFFFQAFLSELRDWPITLVPNSYVILAIFTVSTALIAGVIIDRFSAARLLPFFLVPLGRANMLLGWFDAPWIVAVYMALLGVSYGISSSMFGAIWPEIYGTRNLGSVRSLTMAMMVLASAVGPGVTGILVDWGVGIELQFIGMGVYCVATVVLMTMIAPLIVKRRAAELLAD